MIELPVLYSFRRCPYAIRARMAIFSAGARVELREVDLKNKPPRMLAASPKAEVPVLVLPEGRVVDESLDIMRWALRQHDPGNLLDQRDGGFETHPLVSMVDNEFKPCLDHYKYADRHPEFTAREYRGDCEVFLQRLETGLKTRDFYGGDGCQPSAVDIAILPFVRQFALVDREWFDKSRFKRLVGWLDTWLAADLFLSVMQKHPPWQPGDAPTVFPHDV